MKLQTRGGTGGRAGTALVVALTLSAWALTAASPAVAQEATAYQVVATVENVGAAPAGVAVNGATQTVYVANSDQPDRPGSLAVVDGTAEALTRILFASPDMPNPTHVGVDPTSGRVLVTNPQPLDVNKLTVLSEDAVTGAVAVSRMATSVTVDSTDSPVKAYVANYGDDSRDVSGITIVHLEKNGARVHATTSFSPSRGLTAVAVDTESSPHKAWAVNANTGTDALAGSLTVAESQPNRATFTNWSGVLPAPRHPGLVAVRPGSHTLYLADQSTDQVHLVDLTPRVPAAAPTPFVTDRRAGDKPVAMAYDAGTDRLFVLYADGRSPAGDGELTVLDASSGEILQHLALPSPGGMAVDATTGSLWITDTAHGIVRKVAEQAVSDPRGRFTAPRRGFAPPTPFAPRFDGVPPSPDGNAAEPRQAEPQEREMPGRNANGQLCGAATTRPRC